MSRAKSVSVPSYRFHSASGQAVVTIDGRDFYLGKHGSAASKAEYDRRIAEWTAAGRRLTTDPQGVTVAELANAFRRHAKEFYRDSDGKVSRSIYNFDEALRPLLKLYGDTPAAEFGPLRLKTVREAFVSAGRVRTNVNRLIVRIRGIFKWGAENEIVPASVFHGLMAVAGLGAGRGGAKESEPIRPVPDTYVDAIRPFVSRQVWAMIQLQRLTGMRPGEVVLMRGIDIETTGKLWIFRPHRHKTQLHGHKREVYLGPRARAEIGPFLKLDPSRAYLFSPAEAEAERREKLHAERVEHGTPLSCGNRPGTNKSLKPKRQPGTVYRQSAYYLAVQRGCDRANESAKEQLAKEGVTPTDDRIIPRWHVNQLRHNRATDIRKNFGLEAAQAVLGHSRVETTQIYAERLGETAARVAAEVG